jgi:long-chain acyl-CoA synthetase
MAAAANQRPWLDLYASSVDPDLTAPHLTTIDLFNETVTADPDASSIDYFGRSLSRIELATAANRFATLLQSQGVERGDRVALSLQNTPMFAVAALGVWNLGAVVVPVNPMLRPDELEPMLRDSRARAIVAHPAMSEVIEQTQRRLDHDLTVWWSDPSDFAGKVALPFGGNARSTPTGNHLLSALSGVDATMNWTLPSVDDPALITYTSGTTGPSKGAIATHASLAFQAFNYLQWFEFSEDDSVLTVAPLFHITGLGAHLALALAGGHRLVMTYRFEPRTVLGLITMYKPTFAIGAITAFISLLDAASEDGGALRTLRTIYSGGAPVPSNVVERFQAVTGLYIHNIYGLTESTSACIGVPLGRRAPVDEGSGALSIGVPMGGATVSIVDDNGRPVAHGTQGEIVVSGPQVCAGYWQKPEETSHAFRPEGMFTGDVGVMDEQGWIYVVDRKKDLVVVSGYKVWPRDVEDVIYQHPSIKEVAVVGKPDEYRGETLHAFYSLRAGMTTSATDLKQWCRERLSAYKVPTEFIAIDELPKTPTGKILRRSLRD